MSAWRASPGRNRPVGYVPQKVQLDPDLPLRARDLVELGIDGHRFGVPIPSRVRRDGVDEMLAAVDAEAFADARVGRLSGGEQQRILIAHALISRPEVLLLDEPLANLDLRSGHEIVALLHRIATDQGVAVLLSAHEMNPLLPVMDRVVYLAGGRAATGTTERGHPERRAQRPLRPSRRRRESARPGPRRRRGRPVRDRSRAVAPRRSR